jgi:hypothetical protein
MTTESVLKDAKAEREEVTRALEELESWLSERRQTFLSLQRYMQLGLRTGRITARAKNLNRDARYMSHRMIATLGVEGNQLIRTMMIMDLRRQQLKKRLQEIDELLEPDGEELAEAG